MKSVVVWKTALAIAAGVVVASANAQAQDLSQMISPITNPVNFEDPRHSTELRPIFVYHELDKDLATAGGNVQVYALQARFKLSDDFSIIATKDGWTNVKPNAVVNDGEGFANVTAGAKYSFYRDDTTILTGGLKYEIPIGEHDVLQTEEGGAINPFFSAGTALCGFNIMAGTGMRQAIDDEYSSFWDTDLHVDYPIGNFYPTVEVNLIHVYQDGNRLPIPDEGFDFFNFGSSLAAGENILTAGVGARYRFTDDLDGGIAYQFPLDSGEGTHSIDWRVTTDLIWRFSL